MIKNRIHDAGALLEIETGEQMSMEAVEAVFVRSGLEIKLLCEADTFQQKETNAESDTSVNR